MSSRLPFPLYDGFPAAALLGELKMKSEASSNLGLKVSVRPLRTDSRCSTRYCLDMTSCEWCLQGPCAQRKGTFCIHTFLLCSDGQAIEYKEAGPPGGDPTGDPGGDPGGEAANYGAAVATGSSKMTNTTFPSRRPRSIKPVARQWPAGREEAVEKAIRDFRSATIGSDQ